MSQAAIETLRVIYEAVSRDDWDAAVPYAHPDFEWITADGVLGAGAYRGPEEVRWFFDEQSEAFAEVTFEPEQFFARNDQVVVFVLARARPTGSTALMETRIGHLWAMQNGKAARCEAFLEPAAALQAAGLSEQDAHVDS